MPSSFNDIFALARFDCITIAKYVLIRICGYDICNFPIAIGNIVHADRRTWGKCASVHVPCEQYNIFIGPCDIMNMEAYLSRYWIDHVSSGAEC